MLITGTRNTSGAGTAIKTAAAGNVLKVGRFIQLQINAAGANTIIVKYVLGETTTVIYTADLSDDVPGVIVELPDVETSAAGAALHVDLSAALAMRYIIDVIEVGA